MRAAPSLSTSTPTISDGGLPYGLFRLRRQHVSKPRADCAGLFTVRKIGAYSLVCPMQRGYILWAREAQVCALSRSTASEEGTW